MPVRSAAYSSPTLAVLRTDVPASLVVFVVAVPLSLGIAVASGAPVAAGLIACVVGGVVGGALGGSPLQVSGPAAGLTVIVSTLVQTYGWRATCLIVVGAGLVQLLLGVCRVARLALAVSPAVVRGMLAGVGVVIVLAQLHVVLGAGPQPSALRNLMALPGQIVGGHSHAVAVGLLTIGIMLTWPRLPRRVRVIPGPLAAVAVSALVAWLLDWDVAVVELPHRPLAVWLPPLLPHGDWAGVAGAVLTVAVVGAAESLLCAMAVDRMRADPGPASDLNRELIGQGSANMVSGILGGLPVAGVIVRSSMNVRAGARTRASSILHGVWVLAVVVACTPLVERIPLAALAGLLVVVGCRMLEIAHIRQLHSHREVPVYLITLGGVVLAGLAEGVLAGVAAAAVTALRRLTRLAVRARRHHSHWHVEVAGSLTFLGVPQLLRALREVPPRSHVHLELNLDFMDNAGFEAIHGWRVRHHNQGGTADIDDVHDDWYTGAAGGAGAPARKTVPPARVTATCRGSAAGRNTANAAAPGTPPPPP
jgi:carbonic anhydrase